MTLLARWSIGNDVSSIALSRDGTRLACGTEDGHVRVWDVRTGALVLGTPSGHSGWIQSIAFSSDNTRIASGAADRTICIWNAYTGTLIGGPLKGHINAVCSLAFSPDDKYIASGSVDDSIRMWDVNSGTAVGKALLGHTDSVLSLTFSPDSNSLISGSHDATIRVWDVHTGILKYEPLRGHIASIWSITISNDGARIVSGSSDCSICMWDANSGAPIGEPIIGHIDAVLYVSLSHDSKKIVSGSKDGTVRVWDACTGSPIGQPFDQEATVIQMAEFLPSSARIISGSYDGTICIWEAPRSTPSQRDLAGDMSIQAIFNSLVDHGCVDLSFSINPDRCSSLPIVTGGFGDVWRATLSDGTVFAVKTLRLSILLDCNKKDTKRAAREVHHWSKLRHPNVQQLLGIIIFLGGLGMVSPWQKNGNLQRYLLAHPEVERYRLCVQLSAGVSYLHDVEMVHGDLKASNVLVSDDGTLKINDFDYAILSDSSLRFSTTTRPGGGTLRWMAPELLQPGNENEEDDIQPITTRNKQTDVYALGNDDVGLVVNPLLLNALKEIMSGDVPYSEYRSDMGIYRAIDAKKPPRRPKELCGPNEKATQMWQLLLQCWNHNPSARPDASTVLALLEPLPSE